MSQEAYSVKELSKKWRISEDLVRKAVREGRLPHVRIGKRILFHAETIDKFLRGE